MPNEDQKTQSRLQQQERAAKKTQQGKQESRSAKGSTQSYPRSRKASMVTFLQVVVNLSDLFIGFIRFRTKALICY